MAGVDAKTDELQQVDALLRDPDRNRRIAAMELLLKSGNPTFVARAREVGLFSTDPELQRAALGAIFDAGGPFKLVIDLGKSTDEKNGIKSWMGGALAWDDVSGKGIHVFRTSPYDPKKQCWLNADNLQYCSLNIVGRTITLTLWQQGIGTFELGGDGSLTGWVRYTNGMLDPVPATIPLAE